MLVEPLQGIVGQPTSIFCQVIEHQDSSITFILVDGSSINTDPRFKDGIVNATHREFIIDPTLSSDDGRIFTCNIFSFSSLPVAFTVIRKISVVVIGSYIACTVSDV